MYGVYVRHYDESTQIMEPQFKRRDSAERFMNQQAEIIKGYEKRTMLYDGKFVVLGPDDEFKTTMWVAKIK